MFDKELTAEFEEFPVVYEIDALSNSGLKSTLVFRSFNGLLKSRVSATLLHIDKMFELVVHARIRRVHGRAA